jgi:sodium/proline symporter
MSTADSQLLVTSSAVSEDICRTIFKSKITEKQLVLVSRISVIVIALIALFIASDPNSSVFDIVSYAWAGFGAAFGPAIHLSLYWKRMNWQGALAGILSGGGTVIVWKTFVRPYFDLYELLPAFIVSILFIVVVTLLTKKPSKEIEEEYSKFAAQNG